MIESPLATKTLFTVGPVPITEPVVVTWGLMAALALGGCARHAVARRLRRRAARRCSSSSSARSKTRSATPCVSRRRPICR